MAKIMGWWLENLKTKSGNELLVLLGEESNLKWGFGRSSVEEGRVEVGATTYLISPYESGKRKIWQRVKGGNIGKGGKIWNIIFL